MTPTPLNQSLPNSFILSPPKPYLVLRDTLCSCEAYGMKPMHKKTIKLRKLRQVHVDLSSWSGVVRTAQSQLLKVHAARKCCVGMIATHQQPTPQKNRHPSPKHQPRPQQIRHQSPVCCPGWRRRKPRWSPARPLTAACQQRRGGPVVLGPARLRSHHGAAHPGHQQPAPKGIAQRPTTPVNTKSMEKAHTTDVLLLRVLQ